MSLFTSDDQAAIAIAQVLEGMGLAGKWQQAGPCKVTHDHYTTPDAVASARQQKALRVLAGGKR
jgi:hypothetical protein